ncbi:multidrug efflux MFS transporter [Weissella cibaria]|uniref:MFS transporter n=1 Tax=Weissella cibaria TaxID=137591 RepID=UPI001192222B|nr:MFS transporter [Weissella cibaria]TVV33163.1 multidrug efflux MFS transporter [Weissella cibaria]
MTEKVSPRVIWSIVATAILGFVGILTETSMNVTFPDLIKQFGVPMGTVQWLTTAYLLVVALMMTTSAFLKAIMSPRKIFMWGMALFVIGDVISIVAPGFWPLLAGRLVMAIGTGIALPLVFNVILMSVPPMQIGKYMGFGGLILSLAPALGPVYGGLVTYAWGWRAIFIIVLPIVLIGMILGLRNLSDEKPNQTASFDFMQFIVLGISLTTALLALGQLEAGKLTVSIVVLAVIAILAMIAFIRIALRSSKTLLNLSVFKSKGMVFALLIYAMSQAINLAVNFAIPQYAQLTLGVSTMVAGFVLMPGSLLGSASSPVYGAFYDRAGATKPLTIGSIAFFIVMIVFAVMAPSITTIGLTVMYALFTLGRNLAFTTAMTAGVAEVPREVSGDVNAIFNTIQQFAGAVGTAIAAVLIKTDGSSAKVIAQETATGMGHMFWAGAVIAGLSLVWLAGFVKTKTGK